MRASRFRVRQRLRSVSLACIAWLACREPDATPVQAPAELDPPAAERVVSLSPLASRFALAIGGAHRLVGVDADSAASLPDLAGLPVVDLAGSTSLSPDLVLLRARPAAGDPVGLALLSQGAELVEFEPHDLEDVFDLCRRVGGRLVGSANALRFETDLARPLAQIGGDSFGLARPRVIALVGFDPLELAGGHSFETDLIEIAGGSSLTHGGSEPRLGLTASQLIHYAPDLILAVSSQPWTPDAQRAARAQLPDAARVEFFAFAKDFWLDAPAEVAQRLRAVIEPLSRELEAQAPPRAPPS